MPLAVTFSTLAIVSTPPRWLSGGSVDLLELLPRHAGNAVVPGQPAVEHREVGGHEVRQAQVVLEHLVEEQQRLLDHRHLEYVVVLGVEGGVRGRVVDGAEAEPLAGEVLREGRRFGVFEHPLDLPAERVRVRCSLPCLGEREQFLVGHRTPQEVRQPRRQREVVELARLLAQEQEVRRHQHGLEADAHGLLERGLRVQLGLHAGEERLHVLVGHGPPEGAAHEVAEEALGIDQRLLRDDLDAFAVFGCRCRCLLRGRRRRGGGSAAATSRAAALRSPPTGSPAPAPCSSPPRPSRSRAGSRPGCPRRSGPCSSAPVSRRTRSTVGLPGGTS